MKVEEIMPGRVIAVTPDTGIKDAAGLLVLHGISALPVLDVLEVRFESGR
jgi:CBS domain-containing protein